MKNIVKIYKTTYSCANGKSVKIKLTPVKMKWVKKNVLIAFITIFIIVTVHA